MRDAGKDEIQAKGKADVKKKFVFFKWKKLN